MRLKHWMLPLLMLCVVGCFDDDKPAAKGPIPAADSSKAAPGFKLTNVADSTPLSLESMKGKVVILDFWATWCGPCRMELPHFVKLQESFASKGFSMIGISVDQASSAVVAEFLRDNGVGYPVGHDEDGSVSRDYGGIRAIPTTVLIDKKGLIRQTWVGYHDAQVFEEAVTQLLSES